MPSQPYLSLGDLDGAEAGVQHTDVGQRLARLLQPEAARTVLPGQTVFWRIPHSREVDALLVELIGLSISIRYAHPAIVQLELVLGNGEGMILEPDQP